jgi:hypothetical protein|tara:strand:+ start:464 stop:634 length:171 start_codon:yes stop_codon:yes gene_type:complete
MTTGRGGPYLGEISVGSSGDGCATIGVLMVMTVATVVGTGLGCIDGRSIIFNVVGI